MPDVREEFEAWAEGEKLCLHRGMMGGYYLADTAAAWKAWQASRAAMKVELPPELHAGDLFEDAPVYNASLIKVILQQAGIEVK